MDRHSLPSSEQWSLSHSPRSPRRPMQLPSPSRKDVRRPCRRQGETISVDRTLLAQDESMPTSGEAETRGCSVRASEQQRGRDKRVRGNVRRPATHSSSEALLSLESCSLPSCVCARSSRCSRSSACCSASNSRASASWALPSSVA